MDNLPVRGESGLDEVIRQVRDLQDRVLSLEQRIGSANFEMPAPAIAVVPGEDEAAEGPFAPTSQVIPIFGKALLAIAGAYLLRALAEARVMRLEVCVAAGILYALLWLVLAARSAPQQRLVATVHAMTSVMVLAPLLWEATVRFQAIPSWVSAFVLSLFAVFGLAVCWRGSVSMVAWVTTVAGLFTASALLMATHDLAPFTLALLAIAAAVEISACLEHWMQERWIAALFADLAVLLVTFIVGRDGGLPEGYAPISMWLALFAQAALLAIYLSSTIVRTVVRGFTFTGFETMQCIVAFLLCLGGAVRIAHGHHIAFSAVGAFCLLCGIACYIVSYVFLERRGRHNRNFYTYATFALLLVTAANRILLTGIWLALAWSLLGIVSIYVGEWSGRTTLDIHGAVYLLAAGLFSGWLAWAGAVLLESAGHGTPLTAAQCVAAAFAVPAYLLCLRGTRAEQLNKTAWLFVVSVSTYAVWTLAGAAAGVIHWACGRLGEASMLASFSPTLLTAALTTLSLALAWGGVRWRRFELVWLVYAVMLLAGYKLLFVDFSHSEKLALFVALLFFGGALILLPRILQRSGGAGGSRRHSTASA